MHGRRSRCSSSSASPGSRAPRGGRRPAGDGRARAAAGRRHRQPHRPRSASATSSTSWTWASATCAGTPGTSPTPRSSSASSLLFAAALFGRPRRLRPRRRGAIASGMSERREPSRCPRALPAAAPTGSWPMPPGLSRALRPAAHRRRAADRTTASACRSRDPVRRRGWHLELEVPEARLATSRCRRTSRSTVVYQDDDVLIVDKPAGLVTHPAPGHRDGHPRQRAAGPGRPRTAAGWARSRGVERPGIVHRLDRDTSGLLMVARNDAAQVGAAGAAQGAPRPQDATWRSWPASVDAQLGRIEAPIGRDPRTACGWPSCRTAGRP